MPNEQQQVGFLRRFLIKNFSADPAAMEAYLKSQGVELDPAGFDPQDVTDIFFDTIAGGLISAGALAGGAAGAVAGAPTGPGAPLTGAAGAALGGSMGAQGAESIRQLIGNAVQHFTGVQLVPSGENYSPAAFRREAAVGATAPALGKLTEAGAKGVIRIGGKTTRFGLRQVRSLGQRLSGASKEAFDVAVKSPSITSGTAQTAAQLSDDLAQFVVQPMDKVAELTQAKGLLKDANTVPLKPLLLFLSNTQKSLAIGPGRKGARSEAVKLVENILNEFGLGDKFQKALGTRIPATVAEDIKQQLQREANFSGRVIDDPVNKVFSEASRTMRLSIEGALKTPQIRAQYRKLMMKASAKIDALKELRTRLGVTERTVGGAAQLDIGRTESFIGNLLGKNKTRENRLLQRLDARFGTEFERKGQEAASIQSFGGPGQVENIVPGKITATGAFLGSGLGGPIGGGLGYMVGGLPGMAVGSAAGMAGGIAAASPRSTVLGARGVDALTRGLGAAESKVLRIPARISPAVQTAISTGLRVAETPRVEAPEPEITTTPAPDARARVQQIIDQVNTLPNLTGEQRLQMFREQATQEAQP